MDLDKLLQEKFTSSKRKGYITVEGFQFAETYNKFKNEIDNFEVNEEDVWVCTFPKAGTTWTQEMVWMIMNNLDFENGKKNLNIRVPYLEFSIVSTWEGEEPPLYRTDSVAFTKNQKNPRVIKTHLPFQLLPKELRNGIKKPKIIYVAREPKDTCVSYYYHAKLLEAFRGNFDEFCELFLAGKLNYAPYWRHVLPYWNLRNSPNFLYLKYEDMKKDLSSVTRKVSEFLGRPLSDEQVEILSKHLAFDTMKKNPAVNKEEVVKKEGEKFMRSGKVGDHQNFMSEDLVKRFDDWIRSNIEGIDYVI